MQLQVFKLYTRIRILLLCIMYYEGTTASLSFSLYFSLVFKWCYWIPSSSLTQSVHTCDHVDASNKFCVHFSCSLKISDYWKLYIPCLFRFFCALQLGIQFTRLKRQKIHDHRGRRDRETDTVGCTHDAISIHSTSAKSLVSRE